MKSYFLEEITSLEDARALLRTTLPGQDDPWLLTDDSGDPVAYFNLSEIDVDVRGPAVTVDISGCHYNDDEKVVSVLRKLQVVVGGTITYAP